MNEKQTEYICEELGGVPYFLPCGQRQARMARTMQTNEMGRLLWERLCQGKSREEIAQEICERYQAESEAEVRQDVEDYCTALTRQGILLWEEPQPDFGWEPISLRVGPVGISYCGPERLIERYFARFVQPTEVQAQIRVVPHAPLRPENGTVLLRTEEVLVMEKGERAILLFPRMTRIYELQIARDGSETTLYCDLTNEECWEQMFQVLRFSYLVTVQRVGYAMVHSASMLYRGRAWLVSGRSGTGKSTHTRLWHQELGVPCLNGDLNLLGIKDGQVTVYGQPWCGTSGQYTEKRYPLGGILFVHQAPDNRAEPMTEAQLAHAVYQRLITPAWDPEGVRRNAAAANGIARLAQGWNLYCTKEPEAVYAAKAALDGAMGGD